MSSDFYDDMVSEAADRGCAGSPAPLNESLYWLTVQTDAAGMFSVAAECSALDLDMAMLEAVSWCAMGGMLLDYGSDELTASQVERLIALQDAGALDVTLQRVCESLAGDTLTSGHIVAELFSPEVGTWSLDFGGETADADHAAELLAEAEAALHATMTHELTGGLKLIYDALTVPERDAIADILTDAEGRLVA